MDFDFLTSNLYIAYPFRDDVTVTRPSGASSIEPLLAAARVYTTDQRSSDMCVDLFDIRSSDNWITLDAASITLRWVNDNTQIALVDGANAVATVVAYGSWIVVNWRGTSGDVACYAVIPLSAVEAGSPDTVRFWKASDNAVLLAGLVKQGPDKVRRVYVKQGSSLTQIAGPDEEFVIRPGFNMEIAAGETVVDDVGRKLTRVAINAVPAAGTGKYLLCDGGRYLRTINGTGSDDKGNTNLAPEECYWLELPVAHAPVPITPAVHGISASTQLQPHKIGLRNTCTACCSCDSYIKTYNHLRAIWNTAGDVADRFKSVRDMYHSVLVLYEALLSQDSALTLIQRGNYMFAAVKLYNSTGADITDDITLSLIITLPDGATYTYGTSVVTGLGTARFVVPEDIYSVPKITITDDVVVDQSVYWSTSWAIDDILPDEEINVTMSITGGLTETETRTLVWEDQPE